MNFLFWISGLVGLSKLKMCWVNNLKFCFSLHYNYRDSYLFVYGEEIHKFSAQVIPLDVLCLGSVKIL